MDTSITTEVIITAPVATVWDAFTTPADIKRWSALSDESQATECTVNLREGGKFHLRMKSQGEDPGSNFEGTITKLVPHSLLELSLGDRTASVQFERLGENVGVTVVFNAESEDSIADEQQLSLMILQNFARYVQHDN
ncbi:SRPBCC domain-containing protein [Duganella sp. FT3S]|uniref:SRPBCC domain-containing protein n=1 Tax=Rugamonas fusca TaxID=2758568 RepID=A0A7W2I6N7_9BURK|nr:SRPBCC domain-containing protein [Rugamonas fusca]MBA5605614.1 SRPBCC domain-containing protein [Rugamonas fusca]